MYFLYLLLICYTSILTPVNTYVVIAANLNDFRSLTKKYVPKNLVGQIKAMVLENDHKYYKEPSEDDDRTIEYLDDSQQDNSYEVSKEFKIRQKPVNIYQVKSAPKIALSEPLAPLAKPSVLTLDDIVEKVKHILFQQMLDKNVNARDTNAQAGSAQTGGSLAYKNFPKKSLKVTEAKSLVENPVYKSVPMKVIKEEVQFEATYEDTLDKDTKPEIQYSAQHLQSKPLSDDPKKNRFGNTQNEGSVKKVRFVKQVLVPANSNQGQATYVPQPSMVHQPMPLPSLGQQPHSTVQHSNSEPQLSSMQQSSMVQKPMYPQLHFNQADIQQTTIMKQLVLMQQQIEQLTRVLNRTAQQKDLKKNRAVQPTSPTILDIPQSNIEAVEANFVIIPNPTADVQKTNDGNEDLVEPLKEEADESVLSEEITTTPITETSTKALTVPGTVDNEQFIEENEGVQDTAGTVENDDEATNETTPEEIKESISNEEEDVKPDPETVKRQNKNIKLDANVKIYTQEFGNPDAGEPIVAKTYNFNKPTVEAGVVPVNLKLPVNSARKVMLF